MAPCIEVSVADDLLYLKEKGEILAGPIEVRIATKPTEIRKLKSGVYIEQIKTIQFSTIDLIELLRQATGKTIMLHRTI